MTILRGASSQTGYVSGVDLFARPNILRLARALGFATAALVVPIALSAAVTATTQTPSSVLTAAKAAIAEQSGVHLVVTVKPSSSSATETVVGDWGKTSGMESFSMGKTTMTLEATPTYGYLSGNSAGLTSMFGLTAAQAKKVGKDWVSFKAGTSEYSDVVAGLTISSAKNILPKAKGTKLSTEVAKGTKLYVLTWSVAATSSTPKLSYALTVSAVGKALPVEEIATASGGGKETVMFSRWGEHVVVSAPPASSTIAYPKISG